MMRAMTAPALSVVISNYQGRDVLPDTLESVLRHVASPREILVVDDGSTDGGPDLVRVRFPEVRVIELGRNSGGRLNVVRNRGLADARAPLVLLLDHDIVLEPGCVEALRRAMQVHGAAICTPRLRDRDRPDRIYADGGGLHFLGVSVLEGRDQSVAERPPGPPCATFGGGIMLLDRARVLALGGFYEPMPIGWGDDGELQLRLRLRGSPALHVPAASCFHAERAHGTRRARAQIENRWRVMIEAWSATTLLLLAPIYLAFEFGLVVAAIGGGFGKAWHEALLAVWHDRRGLLARRREIQRTRVVGDGAILCAGVPALPRVARRSALLRAALRIAIWPLDLAWNLARRAGSGLEPPERA